MFENIGRLFKRMVKTEPKELDSVTRESKETAKERLHMVLMQDRANVSADFLELMKEEIIEVIKKYIEVDENTIDVRLITKIDENGTNTTPTLYANIPILNIRNDMKVENFKFQLQSDGAIIAHKIEEQEKELQENAVVEENVETEIKEEIKIESQPEETEKISTEDFSNVDKEVDEENKEEIKIEENQNVEEKEVPENELNTDNEIEEKNNQDISTDSIQNLKKSAKRGRPKKKDRKKSKKLANQNIKESNIEEDDDDEDVTFDDLLKAAEEEDRQKAEQEKKEV